MKGEKLEPSKELVETPLEKMVRDFLANDKYAVPVTVEGDLVVVHLGPLLAEFGERVARDTIRVVNCSLLCSEHREALCADIRAHFGLSEGDQEGRS